MRELGLGFKRKRKILTQDNKHVPSLALSRTVRPSLIGMRCHTELNAQKLKDPVVAVAVVLQRVSENYSCCSRCECLG